ncbi:MAG: DinB family protein [Acidimicrobiales bacterium]|nr:DinB family protein [Acidimicrobiales bacterium]RZV46743.1 MAG: DinB family protein [Acidimicrobiales bacterium]
MSDALLSVRDSIITGFDVDWDQLTTRLDGLTDDEFVWCPVNTPSWSVVEGSDGVARAELEKPDPTPPPFTTIGWRMWHLGPDCLDSYSSRLWGTNGSGIEDQTWTLNADEARNLVDRSFQNFRTGIATSSADELMTPIGEAFGPYAQANRIDLAIHARRELIHHGAEIALLRDLYERRDR